MNPILELEVCFYAQSLSKFFTSQCAQNHQTPHATQPKATWLLKKLETFFLIHKPKFY